jgi:selenocysteine-specific elongation factor
MPREEVKSRMSRQIAGSTPKLFNEIVSRAIYEGWLAEAGLGADRLRLPAHEPTLTSAQQRDVDHLLYTFHEAPYTTPSVTQAEEQVGNEVLASLIEQGQLIKLSEDVLFLTETYAQMEARVTAYLQEHGTITVAEVRDLFDTSRKYALALLGYMDEQRITRRVGDERVLR